MKKYIQLYRKHFFSRYEYEEKFNMRGFFLSDENLYMSVI